MIALAGLFAAAKTKLGGFAISGVVKFVSVAVVVTSVSIGAIVLVSKIESGGAAKQKVATLEQSITDLKADLVNAKKINEEQRALFERDALALSKLDTKIQEMKDAFKNTPGAGNVCIDADSARRLRNLR